MDTNLELEFKVMLTRNQYERLVKRFESPVSFRQVNAYYFYSEYGKRISVRIRTLDSSRTLTFKLPEGQARREVNFPLTPKERNIFKRQDVRAFLESNALNGTFEPIGKLMTDRILVKETHGELCLDKNRYLGVTDYELEYEVTGDPDNAYERFLEILRLENIEYQPAQAKYTRFLKKQRP